MGLVNEADTSSSHLVISCSHARTRETKGDRSCGGQRLGAGEWAIPKSPPGALLWKKEMATCIPSQGALWLRGGVGQMGTIPRKKSTPHSGLLELCRPGFRGGHVGGGPKGCP